MGRGGGERKGFAGRETPLQLSPCAEINTGNYSSFIGCQQKQMAAEARRKHHGNCFRHDAVRSTQNRPWVCGRVSLVFRVMGVQRLRAALRYGSRRLAASILAHVGSQ